MVGTYWPVLAETLYPLFRACQYYLEGFIQRDCDLPDIMWKPQFFLCSIKESVHKKASHSGRLESGGCVLSVPTKGL